MFKGCHFDRSIILLCVRWYLAYGLSLRDLEDMMAERGIGIDHSTIHRWVIRFSPQLLKNFNLRKRSVTTKWHMDETHIKVRGQWMYLYRAIDSVVTRLSSISARTGIYRQQSGSSAKPWIGMAALIVLSLTAVRPTTRPWFRATPSIGERMKLRSSKNPLRSGRANI